MRRSTLRCLLVIAALNAIASCLPLQAATRMPVVRHKVAVIAHRGGKTFAPENTLAAFRNAISLGVDFVEMDVRETKDGGIVIMHDARVDRTTNGKGAVADLDLATIRSLDAGSKFSRRFAGERVPTLDEVLNLCKGRVNVYLDYKAGSVEAIEQTLARHHMRGHVVVYGSVDGLRRWRSVAPGIPVMPSVDQEYRHAGGMRQFLDVLRAEILDGSATEWTRELIDETHQAGALVYVDGLGFPDNEAGYRKMIAMGVDGIQTDHPDRLLATLKSLGM
jgi:glycerophosphoryl diester phosphodiesterase